MFGGGGSSHQCVITYNFLDRSPDTPDVIAAELSANWRLYFTAADLDSNWEDNGIDVLINRGGSLLTGTGGADLSGTASRTSMPIGAAFVLRKRTGIAGRAYRGRCYLPAGFIAESAVDEAGNIDATVLGNYEANWNTFIGALGVADLNMVLVHTVAQTWIEVTGGDLAPKVHWLRRRML